MIINDTISTNQCTYTHVFEQPVTINSVTMQIRKAILNTHNQYVNVTFAITLYDKNDNVIYTDTNVIKCQSSSKITTTKSKDWTLNQYKNVKKIKITNNAAKGKSYWAYISVSGTPLTTISYWYEKGSKMLKSKVKERIVSNALLQKVAIKTEVLEE